MFQDVEVISSYTRAQAIADGVLVDVSTTAKEAGFRYPVAITATAFNSYVVPDGLAASYGNSVEGRLWDTLSMLRYAIAKESGPSILFSVLFSMGKQTGRGCYQKEVQLKAICGPGDTMDPVITIMLPEED
jgi:hypothetical protein